MFVTSPLARRVLSCLLPAALGAMLLAGGATAAPDNAAKENASGPGAALFILDASGSMWGRLPDGQAKISAAKTAIGGLFANSGDSLPVGLMAYGHRRKGDCGDIELLQAPQAGKAATAADLARRLSPRGKTPISQSLMDGAKVLSGAPGKRSLVLVSDGIETCGGDPCAVAASLAGADANLTIHVVGYDVDTSAAAQLACIAEKGRGGYFTANDASGLNSALAKVNNTITRNEPLPEPVKEVKAPEVKATAKSLKIKIAGPGTVALKLAPWAKPPKYWKLLDAETGETIAETGKMELTVKPGTYQIAWRQVEHGAAEVQLPMVVTVKAGETQEVAVDTGIRMVPPEGLQRPYYYQLIADEGELDKPFRKREVAAYYWIWDPVPVPPGDYRLVLRQGEHGWSEADLGRIRIEPGKLNDVMLYQGLNLQWAEEWGADSLYYLKITSEEGREMLFAKRGPVILAPGKYKLTLRYKEHGWSESDWGEITVPEQGYADAGFTSGIRFLSDKKDPRHTIYAVNLDSEKEASITNNWGPFPLLPGRYRLEYQPEGGERFTVAEEIEIPAGTMVEAEM